MKILRKEIEKVFNTTHVGSTERVDALVEVSKKWALECLEEAHAEGSLNMGNNHILLEKSLIQQKIEETK